jgi:KDO2-lipid IV(A) lauroyltransferase
MTEHRNHSIHATCQGPNAFALFSKTVVGLSQKNILLAGRFLGRLAFCMDSRHRRIVRNNLRFVYPQWSSEHIRKSSIRIFQNAGLIFLEFLQTAFLSKNDILRNVRFRGEEYLHQAIENGKGVILISGHMGNWEMANIFLSCYLDSPVVMVARNMKPRWLHQWVYALRSRFGNIILDKRNALSCMKNTLRKGSILGLLIDQSTTRGEGLEVNFFGRTVTATPVAALLARRYDSPVLPVFCIRNSGGELTLIVESPLVLKKTKDLRADLQENTQRITHAIEKAVIKYPEQWFWFHKRWKRHYPFLYPEDLARRRRRREKRKAGAGKR